MREIRRPRWGLAGAVVLGAFVVGCPAPRLSESTLVRQVTTLFEVATAEMVFRDVYYHRSHQSLWIFPFDRRESLFRMSVRVQAGFDLEEGGFSLAWNGSTLVIRLPPPRILSVDVDDESIYEYFSRHNPVGLNVLQEIKQHRAQSLREQALAMGLLNEARRNAQLRLTELLPSLGIADFHLEFLENPAAERGP